METRCGVVLVEEHGLEKGLALFLDALSRGCHGLCITRKPVSFTEPCPRQSLRLSHMIGGNNLRPDRLKILGRTVLDLFAEKENIAVFLEGIDYLALENDLSAVLRLLHLLADSAIEANALLIVSIDPELFQEREMVLLRRALDSSAP
ncbi:MAG: DUF835 domain-containing protein [Candidatus Thermoplasmatota archaeon]